MIDVVEITGISNAWGGGTFLSPGPVVGEILEVRSPYTSWDTAGGTADYTLTRQKDGGTVLAITNQTAPWQYQPRQNVHTVSGGTTTYNAAAVNPSGVIAANGIPCADFLKLAVNQGGSAVAGTVFVHYRR